MERRSNEEEERCSHEEEELFDKCCGFLTKAGAFSEKPPVLLSAVFGKFIPLSALVRCAQNLRRSLEELIERSSTIYASLRKPTPVYVNQREFK